MFDSLPSPWTLVKLISELMTATRATPQDWKTLNNSVGGRLYAGVPFSLPCFSHGERGVLNTPNPEKCAEIQSRHEDHLFRSDNFGAYELPQWETCQTTGDECLLDWKDTLNPLAYSSPRQCTQGSVPSHYIEVKGPNDVRAAFAFTQKTKVPLVIKNSGHDYFGRSSGPGTLALWTRKLDKLVLDRKYVPGGCPSNTEPTTAITIGAGQNFRAIYDLARDNNVTFVSGADPSVGASGGWVMGGGHSAMSPALGLGVDRVLEFKIVTPDGAYRTVNRCQNTDLFFALRGGGGGTFGVVLESTFMATPQVTVQAVLGMFENTRENTVKLLKALANGAVELGRDGWGGYITPSLASAIWGNPLLDEAAAKKSAQSVVDAFASVGGSTIFFTMDSHTHFFDTFISPYTDPVGRPQVLATRLIPSDKFTDDIMLEAMIDGMLDSDFSQILAVAPFGFKDYDKEGTSIHPEWRNAVWHSIMSYNWNFNSTLSERVRIYQKATNMWATVRERTPNAAVYMNEADTYEPDWQKVFWGPHYPRLLAIKEKYDPHHLLDCWRCVGWKGDQDDRYKCYPKAEGVSPKNHNIGRPTETYTEF